MKKLVLLFSIIITLQAKAQVMFYDDFSEDLSADYTMIDNDGRTIAPFLTDQGVFLTGTWEIVNFGEPLGVAYYSASRFTGSDSCMATSDFMVLPVLDFTSANNSPSLSFKAGSNFDLGEISIYATTSIAGTAPTAADFTTPALGNFTLTNDYEDYTVDLTTLFGNSTVYLAIVNESAVCNTFVAVKDIKVKNKTDEDMQLNDMSLITDNSSNAQLAFNYSIAECSAANTSVSIEIENAGVLPMTDTVYAGYNFANSVGTITLIDTILDFATSPLAPGATHMHTYSLDVDLSLFEVTVFTGFVFSNNDGDTLNDLIDHIVVAPNTQDLTTEAYINSFEIDLNDEAAFVKSLAIKFENNAPTTAFSIEDFSGFSDGGSYISDGVNVMQHGYTGPTGFPASDNWFFTSCISFDNTKAYRVSFDYNTLQGNLAPHNLDFTVGSDYSSAAVAETVITGATLADTILSTYSQDFQVSTSGDYHFGVHDASGIGYFLTMDMLVIEELQAPSAPNVSSTWNPCNEEASVTFNFVNGNEYTVDWGDGSAVESVTSSPATHTYTTGSSYTAIVTVSNLAGTENASTSIVADALTTPDAAFTYSQSGSSDASVSFSVDNPLACNTYTWTFGDGNTSTGTTASNTYVAAGTYTVTLSVTNSAGTNSSTQDIVFSVGIENLNFTNGINVYPNPATETLNISFELNKSQNIEINLVAIDGKIVKTSKHSNTSKVNTSLTVNDLSSGIYILDITTEEGKFTSNIIVR